MYRNYRYTSKFLSEIPHPIAASNVWASLVAQWQRSYLSMQVTWVRSLCQEDQLKKEMETHSTILAWEIPWTKEPGGYSPWDNKRVEHNSATKHHQQQYLGAEEESKFERSDYSQILATFSFNLCHKI